MIRLSVFSDDSKFFHVMVFTAHAASFESTSSHNTDWAETSNCNHAKGWPNV